MALHTSCWKHLSINNLNTYVTLSLHKGLTSSFAYSWFSCRWLSAFLICWMPDLYSGLLTWSETSTRRTVSNICLILGSVFFFTFVYARKAEVVVNVQNVQVKKKKTLLSWSSAQYWWLLLFLHGEIILKLTCWVSCFTLCFFYLLFLFHKKQNYDVKDKFRDMLYDQDGCSILFWN